MTFIYPLGHIYIADELNCRIRKIAITTGIVTTIAGDGAQTYRGDNGAATSASIGYPFGVVVDSSGIHILFIFKFLCDCKLISIA